MQELHFHLFHQIHLGKYYHRFTIICGFHEMDLKLLLELSLYLLFYDLYILIALKLQIHQIKTTILTLKDLIQIMMYNIEILKIIYIPL